MSSPGGTHAGSLGLWILDPPLKFEGRGRVFKVTALNERRLVLLDAVHAALKRPSEAPLLLSVNDGVLTGKVPVVDRHFPEEERSRQPSLLSMVRAVVDMFAIEGDPQLGLCGAFGYDLTYQFESIRLARNARSHSEIRFCICLIGCWWWIRTSVRRGGCTVTLRGMGRARLARRW